ncbi:hypothetical protein [Henriciella aquimarina]|uniref:hypothetical protein n=1 Tax=Henriciella aquimarina TaxID=545261 RepID=UPI00117A06AF|nr:hypothetical protein [Henriciella aquimarina]
MPMWVVLFVVIGLPVLAGIVTGLIRTRPGLHKYVWIAAAAPILIYLLLGIAAGHRMPLDVVLILVALAVFWLALGWTSKKITKEVRDAVLDNMG